MAEVIEFFDHATVAVNDLASSRRFYGELLGFQEVPRRFQIPTEGTWFRIGDRELHILVRPRDDRLTGSYHLGFRCKDVATQITDLEAAGVKVVGYPSTRSDGTVQAYVEDPSGNRIELQQRPV